ncbi:MarR family winged helix-turn-helix transcriptional regulator [Sphingomonas asaccharolytica]|uniref:MarR family winged helix-turn-helix transcriptional regulator n=1 Tax=Sphingomonas asaccharolytica TaxID=40681 RepID=UPI000AC0DBFC|nr:MarR family transcriptional regulator [Sphingomonas asaccharolytica]
MDVETGDREIRIALGVLEELAGYHLRRASTVFGNDFSRAMGGTGIRQVLFGILSVVAANPGINQGTAGRALGIQRANMVSLINELVDAGLIDRRTAEEDRRAFALTITPAGSDALAAGSKRIRKHEQRLLSDLSAEERRMLIDLLQRIEAKED